MSKPNHPDLFTTQPDMFGAPPAQSYAPGIEKVRAELHKVLDQARTATVMPWKPKEVSFWRTVFPQMTNWLPDEEAAQLRFEFDEELKRLEAA